MSGKSGNPHVDNAALIVQRIEEEVAWYDDNPEALLRAQIQATRALAYEQRTANLIAFYGDGPKVDAGDPAYAELNKQIVERLGLV